MADILAVVSDLHCNSPGGLLSPAGVTLGNGNHIAPNLVQRWLWDRWLAFWQDVAAARDREGGNLYVLVNGELVDGFHHGSTEFLTASRAGMRQIAAEAMRPALDLSPTALFVIRGTEAHSGKEGDDDDALARELGATVNPQTGAHSFYHLRCSIGGTRLDVKHHGRGARLPWTRGGNANRLAAKLMHDYYRDAPGERPHLALRAHVHLHADSFNLHPIRAIFSDPWQVFSVFGHKVEDGAELPTVGGLIVRCDGDGYEVRRPHWSPARDPMLRC